MSWVRVATPPQQAPSPLQQYSDTHGRRGGGEEAAAAAGLRRTSAVARACAASPLGPGGSPRPSNSSAKGRATSSCGSGQASRASLDTSAPGCGDALLSAVLPHVRQREGMRPSLPRPEEMSAELACAHPEPIGVAGELGDTVKGRIGEESERRGPLPSQQKRFEAPYRASFLSTWLAGALQHQGRQSMRLPHEETVQ